MDGKEERGKLSRRDFLSRSLKIGLGLTAGMLLPGCKTEPPPSVVQSSPAQLPSSEQPVGVNEVLEKADLKELTEFYHIVTDLQSIYGSKILDRSVAACARDFYKICQLAISNPESEVIKPFSAVNWGREKADIAGKVQQHLEEVLVNNLNILPPDKEKLNYVPPEKEYVTRLIANFTAAFPILSLPIEKYQISSAKAGGYFRSPDNLVDLPDPSDNADMFQLVLYHEAIHGAEINYPALRSYMTLADYAAIPTELMRNAANIAREWFSLPAEDKAYKNYGLYLEVGDDKAKLQLLQRGLDLFSLREKIPRDFEILPNDADTTLSVKNSRQFNRQFNWIIHYVGNALLNNGKEIFDTVEKREVAEEMMSYFFDEVTHYLTGPYQIQGALPDSYLRLGREGVNVHNLAMHRMRIRTFLSPELKSVEPAKIRATLGLSETTDPLLSYKSETLTSFKMHDGRYVDIYRLPTDGSQEVFYLRDEDLNRNRGDILILPADYSDSEIPSTGREADVFELSLGSNRRIYLKNDKDRLVPLTTDEVIKILPVPWGFHMLYQPFEQEIQSGSRMRKAGVISTDKIILEDSQQSAAAKEFIWVTDRGSMNFDNLRLYPKPATFSTPTNALVFPGYVESWYFNNTPVITTDGVHYQLFEQIWPTISDVNPGMKILDHNRNNIIRIGDDYNGIYDLSINDEVSQQVGTIIKQFPGAKVSFYFDVTYGQKDQDDLSIMMNIYPNEETLTADALKFQVEKVACITKGKPFLE